MRALYWIKRKLPPARLLLAAAALCIAAAACSGERAGGAVDLARPADGAQREGSTHDGGGQDASFDAAAGDLASADSAASDAPPAADLMPLDLRPWDTIPPPDSNGNPELQVFLLAGQSNMVGLGYNNQLSGAQAATVPGATIYYNDGIHSNPNSESWRPLGPGFGVTADRFGPELGFGQRLRQLWPGRPFALIKVAEGGTSLESDWTARTGPLYQLLLGELQAQLAALSNSWQPRLAGLIWMQGESDGTSLALASAYQARLTSFVDALRQDLGAAQLPVVAGLISPHASWPYAEQVRQATRAVSTALPPMEVVEAADLPRDPADDVHYNSQGSLILGRRFAEAAVALQAQAWHQPADFGANSYNRGWSYWQRSSAGSAQPLVYDRASDRWAGSEPALLVGRGWMHPGPSQAAELVWRAPGLGLMQLTVAVQAADNGGGDGTWVEVAKETQLLWGPQALPNGGQANQQLQVLVQPGEALRFRTWAGPAQDNSYDATGWQIDIVHAGP